MILLHHFYNIQETIHKAENIYQFYIEFNTEHEILKAHFPNQPIVPGACLSQISKELVETIENTTIHILQFNQLKFLNTINPQDCMEVTVQIEIKTIDFMKSANISIFKASQTFAKLNFTFE